MLNLMNNLRSAQLTCTSLRPWINHFDYFRAARYESLMRIFGQRLGMTNMLKKVNSALNLSELALSPVGLIVVLVTVWMSGCAGFAGPLSPLSVTPNSLSVSTTVGSTGSQAANVTNIGSGSVNITDVNVSGTGFSVVGLTLPATLSPGQSRKFGVRFVPSTSGSVDGSLSIGTDAAHRPLVVRLHGEAVTTNPPPPPTAGPIAVSPGQLSTSVSTLNFNKINVGDSSSQAVTFTNAGSSDIVISNVSISGAGYNTSGAPTGVVLPPGQTATLNVTFAPAATGSVTGRVNVASNASNSPASITLLGTGIQPIAHSATLTWTPSTTPTVTGYNVYRATASGEYAMPLNSSPIPGPTTQFEDSTVQAGNIYYYVVTSVDSDNVQSVYSNEVSATIPMP